MTLKVVFSPYAPKVFDQMREGTNPFYPPHLMLEVLYSPALAHPQHAGYAIQQMGTRAWLDYDIKTFDQAVQRATEIAKGMLPNGIVFTRELEGEKPERDYDDCCDMENPEC